QYTVRGWKTQKSGRNSIPTEYRKNNSKLFLKLFYWKETGILVTVCTDCIRNGNGTVHDVPKIKNNESEMYLQVPLDEKLLQEEDEPGEREI
ncbi:MAG: hypothetical protein ACK559_24375, partial [bacterium]